MNLLVREAKIADAAAFQAFVADLFGESLSVIFEHSEIPTIKKQKEFISKLAAQPTSCLFLAFNQEQLIGVLDLHGLPNPQRAHCATFGMSVAKQFRNHGVGRALVESMLEFAKGTDILSRIELEVFENNSVGIHLYEKMGFRHEGRKRAGVRVKDSYIDILSMALLLNEGKLDEIAA